MPALGLHDFRIANFAFLEYLKNRSVSIGCCDTPGLANKILDQTFLLKDIGVENLQFRLNAESLYRVFNRGSFKYNGRAYGALHQRMPKQMRPFVLINGRKTVELDYSAYHIMMLYHKEGINYQEDPYVACGGPELRDVFKAVGLIAINAKTIQSAYGGIRDELRNRNIPMPKFTNPLKTLVEMFRKPHWRIEKYLFSDAGVWLQNLDSHIMNAILMKLMKKGILGLSVYDSVIVEEQHRDILYKTMIREYKNVMGFKPRL